MRSFQVPATPGHLRLAAEFSVRTDFAGHTRYFGGENAELLNHRVDDVGRAQELAFERASVHIQTHGLRQIALRDCRDGARDFSGGPKQIFDQRIDRDFHLAPRSPGFMKAGALAGSAFFSDHLANALQFLRHLLVGGDDGIESVGNLACDSGPGSGKTHRKISIPHGLQAGQNYAEIGDRGRGNRNRTATTLRSAIAAALRSAVALAVIVLAFFECAIGNGCGCVSAVSLHKSRLLD